MKLFLVLQKLLKINDASFLPLASQDQENIVNWNETVNSGSLWVVGLGMIFSFSFCMSLLSCNNNNKKKILHFQWGKTF